MQQSYARSLLCDLAIKLGRRPQDMERFIRILEKQWYDSKEALAKLQPSDYARLQIPQRLASMIAEAVGASRPQQNAREKMDVQSPIQAYLGQLKSKLQGQDFDSVVDALKRIFNNIRQNLINEKYRQLKKSNAKIAALANMKQVVKILRHGGFEETREGFVMTKINISQIDQCIESIAKFLPANNFNPFQSHISSIGSTTVESYEGSSTVMYNKMLEDLEKERIRIMSQPIYDRKIKVFEIEPQFQKQFDRHFQEDKESQEEEKYLELQHMKAVLKKQGEEPKFMNRRMQEYQQLVKKPVFAETLIRVKLPENWIFECRFSPMETLQTLVDVFQECLQNRDLDYYLYMTPPVQKLSGILLRKTFNELDCVPRAIFYMKCQKKLGGNIFRIKKTNF